MADPRLELVVAVRGATCTQHHDVAHLARVYVARASIGLSSPLTPARDAPHWGGRLEIAHDGLHRITFWRRGHL